MIKEYLIKIQQSLKLIFIGIIIGIFLSIFVYYKVNIKENINTSDATVHTNSGMPIFLDKIVYRDKKTIIDTHYDGEGNSTITIPNKLNPSANKWDNSHWLAGGFVSTDKAIYLGGGYRYDRAMIVGGPWFRNNNGYSGGLWIGGFWNF
jgi:hypothetical protein